METSLWRSWLSTPETFRKQVTWTAVSHFSELRKAVKYVTFRSLTWILNLQRWFAVLFIPSSPYNNPRPFPFLSRLSFTLIPQTVIASDMYPDRGFHTNANKVTDRLQLHPLPTISGITIHNQRCISHSVLVCPDTMHCVSLLLYSTQMCRTKKKRGPFCTSQQLQLNMIWNINY